MTLSGRGNGQTVAMDRQTTTSTGDQNLSGSGRWRRCAVFAPTTAAGWLLAVSMFLPLGMYRGCNSPPQAIVPFERQIEEIDSGDFTGVVTSSLPFVLGLAIGLATLVLCCYGSQRAFAGVWSGYAVLIVLASLIVLSDSLVDAWNRPGSPPGEYWTSHAGELLTVFWLLNIVWATWMESRSWFAAAMILQLLLVALIWLGLMQWLLFLDELLIGGWLTAISAATLPLLTILQIFGDPASGRRSLRRRAVPCSDAPNGTPQFSLYGLLVAMTLCAAMLSIGQVWGGGAAVLFLYPATLLILGFRRLRIATLGASKRAAAWYFLAACLLIFGVVIQ